MKYLVKSKYYVDESTVYIEIVAIKFKFNWFEIRVFKN